MDETMECWSELVKYAKFILGNLAEYAHRNRLENHVNTLCKFPSSKRQPLLNTWGHVHSSWRYNFIIGDVSGNTTDILFTEEFKFYVQKSEYLNFSRIIPTWNILMNMLQASSKTIVGHFSWRSVNESYFASIVLS